MSEPFDPYRKWLGILPAEQPPDHYRLLGIVRFEDDADTIIRKDLLVSNTRPQRISPFSDPIGKVAPCRR